jgi:hypothetical protein
MAAEDQALPRTTLISQRHLCVLDQRVGNELGEPDVVAADGQKDVINRAIATVGSWTPIRLAKTTFSVA